MKITIHRGSNQIGGCITEIASNRTRILIDLGQNLPNGDGVVNDDFDSPSAIEELTKDVDAIFYTHYHGDHVGLFHLVPELIPQYIGEVAKKVLMCKHQHLSFIKGRENASATEISKIEKMRTFSQGIANVIGDIKVTPYIVSHSAYDAYMFLIEVDGVRVLHTGDFRGHGYLSKGLKPTIEKHILKSGKIDFIIIEGTMLSRINETVRHENELKKEVAAIMKQYKNVFVLCSSTDLERLATFSAANKAIGRRPFICDSFQRKILQIFTESAGEKSSIFNFEEPYVFRKDNTKLLSWMQDQGFCMLVRASEKFDDYLLSLESSLDKNKTVLIYSMWSEYINSSSKHLNKRYSDLVERFPEVKKIHTSGHASSHCITDVCNLVNPSVGIIPIHTEYSNEYQKLPINEQLKFKIFTDSTTVNNAVVEILN